MILVITVWCLSRSHAQGESETVKAVRERVTQFHQLFNEGEYDKAFDMMLIGSKGYLLKGEMVYIPDEETRDSIVEHIIQLREMGYREIGEIQDLEVVGDNRGAVATFISNTVITHVGGETQKYKVRSTELWLNEEGEWKLFHWHYSEYQPMQGNSRESAEG